MAIKAGVFVAGWREHGASGRRQRGGSRGAAMEQAFTTDARCFKPMFTTPRLGHIQADGASVCSTRPETGRRQILHVSSAEEDGGDQRFSRRSVRWHYDIAWSEVWFARLMWDLNCQVHCEQCQKFVMFEGQCTFLCTLILLSLAGCVNAVLALVKLKKKDNDCCFMMC